MRMRVFLNGTCELFVTYRDLKLPLLISDDGISDFVKEDKDCSEHESYMLVTLSIIVVS